MYFRRLRTATGALLVIGRMESRQIHTITVRAMYMSSLSEPYSERNDHCSNYRDSADSDEAKGSRKFVTRSIVDEHSSDDDATALASEEETLSFHLAQAKLKRPADMFDRMRELDFRTITTIRDDKPKDYAADNNTRTTSDAESISNSQI
ncbi:hypothetical protein HD806DRAFT_527716 [Xylariaceae sp. AK1471]|nr:hypothetical protein HD806DRAFT_527716 [Xylariaceae sp. AK1471]